MYTGVPLRTSDLLILETRGTFPSRASSSAEDNFNRTRNTRSNASTVRRRPGGFFRNARHSACKSYCGQHDCERKVRAFRADGGSKLKKRRCEPRETGTPRWEPPAAPSSSVGSGERLKQIKNEGASFEGEGAAKGERANAQNMRASRRRRDAARSLLERSCA